VAGGPAGPIVPAADDSLIGQVLGDAYRVTRMIGEGGMGTVYEATHLRLPKRVAIKCLNRDLLRNQEAFARFQREAVMASSLGNRHIVEVVDFNYLPDGSPYMVMEYLDGEMLSARLHRRGRLEPAEVLEICGQVASALSTAHKQNVVHRDLKPDNIFLCPSDEGEFVKLLDFGVSKIRGGEQNLTGDLAMLGTPSYMSPEQARGDARAVDHRADVYALGAVVYEMLTGEVAFGGETVYEVVTKIATQMPPPMHLLVPGLPPSADAVVRLALSKDPTARPESAAELLRLLTAAFEDEATEAFDLSAGEPHPADLEALPTVIAAAPVLPAEEATAAVVTPPVEETAAFAQPDYLATTAERPGLFTQPAYAEAAPEVEPPALDARTAISASPYGAETFVDQRVTDRMPQVRRSRAGPIVVALVTVVVAAVGVVVWLMPHPRPHAPGAETAPLVAEDAGPAPAPASLPAAAAAAAPTPAPAADEPEPAEPETPKVRLKLKVTPAKAKVLLDGEPVTGAEVATARSAIPRKLEASAPGYQPKTVTVVPSEDRVVRIDLRKAGRARPPRAKAPPPRPRTIMVPPRP
jgi:eukaryotic-like serine/threonine-protein kinase